MNRIKSQSPLKTHDAVGVDAAAGPAPGRISSKASFLRNLVRLRILGTLLTRLLHRMAVSVDDRYSSNPFLMIPADVLTRRAFRNFLTLGASKSMSPVMEVSISNIASPPNLFGVPPVEPESCSVEALMLHWIPEQIMFSKSISCVTLRELVCLLRPSCPLPVLAGGGDLCRSHVWCSVAASGGLLERKVVCSQSTGRYASTTG